MINTYKSKKIIRNILMVVLSAIGLPLVVMAIYFLFVPNSRPPIMVRNYVFNQLIFTDFVDAEDKIEGMGWQVISKSDEHGLVIHYNDNGSIVGSDFATDENILDYEASDQGEPSTEIVGAKSMQVDLGDVYGSLFATSDVMLAFDDEGKLVEVAMH